MNGAKKRYISVRGQFTALFFVVVFGFFFLLILISYLLRDFGFIKHAVGNPWVLAGVLSVLCILMGYAASFFLMNRIFSPLEQLSAASKSVAKGDYDIQLRYDGRIEEVDNTIRNFNFMVQELNSLETLRSNFISNASHELKTPLAAITGYATLLQDPERTAEQQREDLQKILFHTKKLNDLAYGILQLSRVENQSTLPAPVTYRLDEQLREAVVALENQWSEKETNLVIDLTEITYTGQRALLLQVWQNLISNAIKFSERGGTVSVTLAESQNACVVRVRDDGIGMDGETQAHIYDKFYQGDTSHQGEGHGLGLAFCREALSLCGCVISVESEPGNGTCFTVTLPKDI